MALQSPPRASVASCALGPWPQTVAATSMASSSCWPLLALTPASSPYTQSCSAPCGGEIDAAHAGLQDAGGVSSRA
eukprot:365202-Chlamydomonas_euryale.AAC.9